MRIPFQFGSDVALGQVYRLGRRRLRVVSIFFQVVKEGRLKANTWYARCGDEPFRPFGPRTTISCRNLKSRFTLVEAPTPAEEKARC